jgi:hypothetical protein
MNKSHIFMVLCWVPSKRYFLKSTENDYRKAGQVRMSLKIVRWVKRVLEVEPREEKHASRRIESMCLKMRGKEP